MFEWLIVLTMGWIYLAVKVWLESEKRDVPPFLPYKNRIRF